MPTRYSRLPGSLRSIVTQRDTSSTWPMALIKSDGGMAIGSAAPWGRNSLFRLSLPLMNGVPSTVATS